VSWLARCEEGVRVEVLIVPRASRTGVVGVHDDRLKLQLQAPPVEGEANAALVALLAKGLGIRKADVEIRSGANGRRKTLVLRGVTEDAVRAWAGGD